MTNQLITYRLPIDYSLISLMSSISYAWDITLKKVADKIVNVLARKAFLLRFLEQLSHHPDITYFFNSTLRRIR